MNSPPLIPPLGSRGFAEFLEPILRFRSKFSARPKEIGLAFGRVDATAKRACLAKAQIFAPALRHPRPTLLSYLQPIPAKLISVLVSESRRERLGELLSEPWDGKRRRIDQRSYRSGHPASAFLFARRHVLLKPKRLFERQAVQSFAPSSQENTEDKGYRQPKSYQHGVSQYFQAVEHSENHQGQSRQHHGDQTIGEGRPLRPKRMRLNGIRRRCLASPLALHAFRKNLCWRLADCQPEALLQFPQW